MMASQIFDFKKSLLDTMSRDEPNAHSGLSERPECSTASADTPVGEPPQLSLMESTPDTLMDIFREEKSQSSAQYAASFDLPLGAEISVKIKRKIVNREYIPITTLIGQEDENVPVNFTSPDGSHISMRPSHANKRNTVMSIEQWSNAMLVYAAIYIEAHPHEATPLLTYISFVRNMARTSPVHAWRSYDEKFRRVRATTAIAWDKPLLNTYFETMLVGLRQPFQGNSSSKATGSQNCYCFGYQSDSCRNLSCNYQHLCAKCNGAHPSNNCRELCQQTD